LTKSLANGLMRWSPDGPFLYFLGGDATRPTNSIWALDTSTGVEREIATLTGRPGVIGSFSLAVDDRYVYFTIGTQLADLWIMDVVTSN
jgi:Tol biopolymer transport system component